MTATNGANPRAWVILFVLSIIWGSSFILIKKGLLVFSPGEVGAIRIGSAGIVLLPFALKHFKSISTKNWIILFVIGLCGSFIPSFLYAKAQTQLDSSITGVINALTPVFTLILGALFFGQSFTARNAIGLGIAFLGTVWLALVGKDGGVGNVNFYVLFVVLATILYAINTNGIKAYLSGMKPLMIASVSLTVVLPLSLGYLFGISDFYAKLTTADGATYSFSLLLILGVLGTAVALVLFNQLVQISTAIFASSVTYIIPIVATTLGLLDGEVLQMEHYIGMLAILVGVYISNRK